MTRVPWWMWVWMAVLALGGVALLLSTCGGKVAPWPARVCATYQAPDGTWMEEDNEPVDADPCDTKIDLPKPATTTKKPATVKPAPARTSKPIGGQGKKF